MMKLKEYMTGNIKEFEELAKIKFNKKEQVHNI